MVKAPTDPKEVEGLRLLRTGYFLSIIFAVILAAAMLMLLAGLPALLNPFAPGQAVTFVIAIVVLLLIAIAFNLYITIRYFGGGYRLLSEVDSSFNICVTGVRLYIIGVPIVFVGALILIGALAAAIISPLTTGRELATVYLAGLIVLLLGGIIAAIGSILYAIVGPFKLNSRYEESLLLIGAIFLIIGLLIPILPLVGVILIYIGIGHVLERRPAPGP